MRLNEIIARYVFREAGLKFIPCIHQESEEPKVNCNFARIPPRSSSLSKQQQEHNEIYRTALGKLL